MLVLAASMTADKNIGANRLEDLRSLDNIAAEGLSTLHNVLDSASLAEAFCIIGLLPSAAHCMGT